MTQNTNQLIQEAMESYYEYVAKIEGGCNSIVELLKADEVEKAMHGIRDLSDGLVWLLEVERHLEGHSYKIDSPISQITPLFQKINEAIETNNLEAVINLFEAEFNPLFLNAKQWQFEEVIS
ncbi:hypothetical protein NSQ62_02855 [Solibacillus sp. FSL H8-0523]|uniref:hypothetical protein n=1 Tax=Solibacillus sp. FSL H8-0523 TaxID=2954511 RepID=UPI0031010948